MKRVLAALAISAMITGTAHAQQQQRAQGTQDGRGMSRMDDDMQGGKRTRMRGQMRGAQMRGAMMRGGMSSFSHPVLANAEELELTDEQLGRIMRLQQDYRAQRQEMRRSMMTSMHGMSAIIMDPAADRDAVTEQVEAHNEAYQQWARSLWEEREAVMQALNDQQREKLQQEMQQWMSRMGAGGMARR